MWIFPSLAGAKIPATVNGLHAATLDVECIRAGWQFNPDFNIGIATGPSGLVVIDCDAGKPWPLDTPPPAGVIDGADVLCCLAETLGQRPELLFRTAGVRTPSGGVHLYYRAPAGRTFKNTAGRLGAWIDTRAVGGYVVGPWSVLPAGEYLPIAGFDTLLAGGTVDAAPLPMWLADALDPPAVPARDPYRAGPPDPFSAATGYVAAAVAGEAEKVRTAATGTRNHTLVRAAFRVGQVAGADDPDVFAQLLAAATGAGLTDREGQATIRSGLTAGAANPRQAG